MRARPLFLYYSRTLSSELRSMAPSTLMRFRITTDTFFYLFSPSVHMNMMENGGVCLRKSEVFENASLSRGF